MIVLNEQNNSKQSGTATLTAKGDKTEVVLALSLGPAGAGVAQPAHIHTGSCATLGGVRYPLTSLADGKSTTTVDAALDSLLTGGFAINAHKSAQEVSVYTACGDIPAKAGGAPVSPSQMKEIKITAGNLRFDPAAISVKPGEAVKLVLSSTDLVHTFTISELGINLRAAAGQTATQEVTFDKGGTYTFFCAIGNHRSAGMEGKLSVGEPVATPTPGTQTPDAGGYTY